MSTSEMRKLSMEELQAKSRELRGELFNVKIKQATGQLESTAKLRELRWQIARAETVIRQRSGAKQ